MPKDLCFRGKRTILFGLMALLVPISASGTVEVHVLPLHPIASDNVSILLEGPGCRLGVRNWSVESGLITLRAETFDPCTGEQRAATFEVGRLPLGEYAVDLRVDGVAIAVPNVVIGSGFLPRLELHPGGETGYVGTILWRFPGGSAGGSGFAVVLSPLAGYFWFRSPDNPEVVVKILDGRAINGHRWLFLNSLTTLPFTLALQHCDLGDPPHCEVRTYEHAGGAGRLILDLTLE